MRAALALAVPLALSGCQLPGAEAFAPEPVRMSESPRASTAPDPPPEPLDWRTGAGQPMSTVRALALRDQTCRMPLRLDAGGRQLRLRLSNGGNPATTRLSAVTVALGALGPHARPGSVQAVTVAGSASITLPPDGFVTTDPVSLPTSPGDEVLVSFAVGALTRVSAHRFGAATGWCSRPGTGDLTITEDGAAFVQGGDRAGLVVDDVSVAASARSPLSVVAAGDSLTDAPLPPDTYQRWTDVLAAQLADTPVVNAGIAGNRVLMPGGLGPSLVSRFGTDVLERSGVGTVVLLAGTNDLSTGMPASRLVTALTDLGAAARARGLRVVLLTIPPAHKRPAEQNEARRVVNDWVRTSGVADVVVDADAVLGDGARLRPAYDSGDGLHLSPAGHRALASAVATALRRCGDTRRTAGRPLACR